MPAREFLTHVPQGIDQPRPAHDGQHEGHEGAERVDTQDVPHHGLMSGGDLPDHERHRHQKNDHERALKPFHRVFGAHGETQQACQERSQREDGQGDACGHSFNPVSLLTSTLSKASWSRWV